MKGGLRVSIFVSTLASIAFVVVYAIFGKFDLNPDTKSLVQEKNNKIEELNSNEDEALWYHNYDQEAKEDFYSSYFCFYTHQNDETAQPASIQWLYERGNNN